MASPHESNGSPLVWVLTTPSMPRMPSLFESVDQRHKSHPRSDHVDEGLQARFKHCGVHVCYWPTGHLLV